MEIENRQVLGQIVAAVLTIGMGFPALMHAAIHASLGKGSDQAAGLNSCGRSKGAS